MALLTIIGAGPGLGAATARRFAREGFAVALISRSPDRLDDLRDELTATGVSAHSFAADVTDSTALRTALRSVADELGPIEVLQYSPAPPPTFLRPVLETDIDDLRAATEFSIIAPATAVQAVLPSMEQLGRGTILLVNGASAATPNGKVAGTSIAFAGESAYGVMLHQALAPRNIHVGQLIVPGAIGGGDPLFAPDALADRLWRIHTERGPLRTTVGTDPA